MKDKLNTMDVPFVVETVEEGGVEVTQVTAPAHTSLPWVLAVMCDTAVSNLPFTLLSMACAQVFFLDPEGNMIEVWPGYRRACSCSVLSKHLFLPFIV